MAPADMKELIRVSEKMEAAEQGPGTPKVPFDQAKTRRKEGSYRDELWAIIGGVDSRDAEEDLQEIRRLLAERATN